MKAWQTFGVVMMVTAAGCAGPSPRPVAGADSGTWSRRPTTIMEPAPPPDAVFMPPDAPGGFAHFSRQIRLTSDASRDEALGVDLVRVEPDGTVFIKVDESGETLSAKPGGFFMGAYQRPSGARTFGTRGLGLESSDPVAQSAVLTRRWAEHR